MDWDWTAKLRELVERGEELVIATLLEVRGHAPREAGAKMLVTPGECFGTIGGGNVEKTALERARNLLRQGSAKPETFTLRLNPKEGEWGVQCCGGEVLLLLEPVLMRGQQVAIFGIGHVGLALAKVLSDLPFELLLVDSRPEMLSEARLKVLGQTAKTRVRYSLIPEQVMAELRGGAFVIVMTHDHAEDLAVVEAALNRKDLAFIGLIGSRVKWSNFRRTLTEQGFGEQDLGRVTTPIGIPGVNDKRPVAIAIAVAAQILSLSVPVEQRENKPSKEPGLLAGPGAG